MFLSVIRWLILSVNPALLPGPLVFPSLSLARRLGKVTRASRESLLPSEYTQKCKVLFMENYFICVGLATVRQAIIKDYKSAFEPLVLQMKLYCSSCSPYSFRLFTVTLMSHDI